MALKFRCNYCPAVFPHFKALVEHYETHHSGKLKRYEVRNKVLKQVALQHSPNPEEICRALGWDINDCKVKEIN